MARISVLVWPRQGLPRLPLVPRWLGSRRWVPALRPARLPPLAVGLPLAVLVAVVVDIAIMVGREPGSRPPDALAYALGALIGALVLGRRRWPLTVLSATAVTMVAYYSLGYPGLPPGIPLAVALYSAAVAGWLRASSAISAFFVVGGVLDLGFHHPEPPLQMITAMVQVAALLGVVVMLGHTVRIRRIRLAEAAERVRLVEADREAAASRRVAAERLRIARELHDVLGHTTTLIGVQAQVAADALDRDPAQARSALRAIHGASREAMAELKATVELLREDGAAPREPTPGLGQLSELCEVTRRAGVRVEATMDGENRELPVAVDLAAYRIVQESLTNVVRHSGAGSARVTISCRQDALVIDVTDDGTGGAAGATGNGPEHGHTNAPGSGINGMAERAAGLDGSLRAAPRPGGGFGVHARLPLTGSRP